MLALGCGLVLLVVLAIGLWIVISDALLERKIRQQNERRYGPTESPGAWRRDLTLDASCQMSGFGAVAAWQIQVWNGSESTTYRDLRYETTYSSESGRILDRRHGALLIIVHPKARRIIQRYVDGPMPQQTSTCVTMKIVGADAD